MSSEFAPRPSRRAGRRLAAVAGPVAIGMILLAVCGSSSDDGATESTIDLSEGSTAFVVRPPETTLAPDTTVAPGGVSTAAQDYTVQSGDYPLKVAQQFGVTVDELVAFNEWGSVNEFPFPGTVIKIPPGGTVAAATPETTVGPAAATGGEAAAAETTVAASTIPDAGDTWRPRRARRRSGRHPDQRRQEVRRHARRAQRRQRTTRPTASSSPVRRSSSPPRPTADLTARGPQSRPRRVQLYSFTTSMVALLAAE